MNPTSLALTLAVPLLLLGAVSGYFQLRGRWALTARKLVPSDEHAYLRNRYRRRLLAAGLMVAAGAMIATAYLSGMEAHADALGRTNADGTKKTMTDDDKQFIRFWGLYWIAVLGIVFALVTIGILDAWATRRFWLGLYKEMRADHQAQLRRDLAVYRQDRDNRRSRGFRKDADDEAGAL